jgi:hypothetical protein
MAYEGMAVKIHEFLTSLVDGGGQPAALPLGERPWYL